MLQTITNPGLSVYGAAMDEANNTLWWWSQDGTGTTATAMDPTTGTFPGDAWDGGTGTWPGIADGACIYDDTTHGIVLGGMHQASPDNVCVYSLVPDPIPQIDVKVNGGDAGVVVPDTSIVTIVTDIEARTYAGVPVDIFHFIQAGSISATSPERRRRCGNHEVLRLHRRLRRRHGGRLDRRRPALVGRQRHL